MADILLLDDDKTLCGMLQKQLADEGHYVETAHSIKAGKTTIGLKPFDIILLDVGLPDGNGLEHIGYFKKTESEPEIIIITGFGDPNGAEKAILNGAWSYVEKPYVSRDLGLHLMRALQYRHEKQRIRKVPVSLKREHIVGKSQAVNNCLDLVARASVTDVSVLITGETGTGKELFAKAIHENSDRSGGNFVIVDCASLPETLVESTLFGHVKGAFTGADRVQDGLVKHAHNGTLFLDEVGELPLSVQKTFLRLLQEHEYRPVGSSLQKVSDFRLVAATNRNLHDMVAKGEFRSDLLFRLEAFILHLPPLRERLEDIRELVTYFISRLCERYNTESKGVGGDLIETLKVYDWPGNVRELYQTIEQIFTNPLLGPTCFSIHLPEKFRILQLKADLNTATEKGDGENTRIDGVLPWRDYKNRCEKEYLYRLRSFSDGNVSQACRLSGLSRTRLYQLIEKYQLSF